MVVFVEKEMKWTWRQSIGWLAVKRSLREHLPWRLSVTAISHLILGRGHALGHPRLRDKAQPCFSSLCDLGLGS